VSISGVEHDQAPHYRNLLVALYDYDPNGNRTRRTLRAASEPYRDEASGVDSLDISDVGHDYGREVLRRDYSYNFENQLIRVQNAHLSADPAYYPDHDDEHLQSTETELIYDGYGRLLRREFGYISEGRQRPDVREQITYVYDGLDPIVEYLEDQPDHGLNGIEHDYHEFGYFNYYRGLGHILSASAIPDANRDRQQGTHYYHYDGLGSVSALTNQQGQLAHTYQYADYGRVLDRDYRLSQARHFTEPRNQYTYTGQEWDNHTELFHYYAREYDPTTGTWLTQDPYRGQISEPTTLHRYQFVRNNPINLIELYGFQVSGCGIIMSCQPSQSTGCGTVMSCVLPSWSNSTYSYAVNALIWNSTQNDPAMKSVNSGTWLRDLSQLDFDNQKVAGASAQLCPLGKICNHPVTPRIWYDYIVDGVAVTVIVVAVVWLGFEAWALIAPAITSSWPRLGPTLSSIPNSVSQRAPEIVIKSEHAARHLVGTGLDPSEVESAIIQSVQNVINTTTGPIPDFRGLVTVAGRLIEYRAFPVSPTLINVGTYVVLPP
ncbi:MAG: RHS repeat-associated core domain-containing protein, partial [Nitrososphaera sp.]|nr:RHS repeat-associated core domain-containing protein [Nitrososphaera sp.]